MSTHGAALPSPTEVGGFRAWSSVKFDEAQYIMFLTELWT